VLTALIVVDFTNGKGRFNLAQGFVGMTAGIGATLSTTFFCLIVGNFGRQLDFSSLSPQHWLQCLVSDARNETFEWKK
jgi:hypothetical protein